VLLVARIVGQPVRHGPDVDAPAQRVTGSRLGAHAIPIDPANDHARQSATFRCEHPVQPLLGLGVLVQSHGTRGDRPLVHALIAPSRTLDHGLRTLAQDAIIDVLH